MNEAKLLDAEQPQGLMVNRLSKSSEISISPEAKPVNTAIIQTANKILELVGPGKFLHFGAKDDSLVCELLKNGSKAIALSSVISHEQEHVMHGNLENYPFNLKAFDTLIIDSAILAGQEGDPLQLAGVLAQITTSNLIVWQSEKATTHQWKQADWDHVMLHSGFRRHPTFLTQDNYSAFNHDALQDLVVYEVIPDEALSEWPLEKILPERDLHMDMLRESGSRADAHIVRYALAAKSVRPGDVVLDCACGLGYGSAVIAATSRASKVIGVDIHELGLEYAKANYGKVDEIEFHVCDAENLAFLPDNSVDFISSFETIEHVLHPKKIMAEFARVLRPDGRIVSSVPFLWMDETGKDPNPYHYHVFDHESFSKLFAKDFLIEKRYLQIAPGGFKLHQQPRILVEINEDQMNLDAEWLVYTASVNPLQYTISASDYTHPAFESMTKASGAHLTDFGKHYQNPWIYRSMVQMGERIDNPAVLLKTIHKLIVTADKDSADYGAALGLAGYRVMEAGDIDAVDNLIAEIQTYQQIDSENPHVYRWQISLAFLAGRLEMIRGKQEQALSWFKCVTEKDPDRFSPLLATKTVGAHFWSAIIQLSLADKKSAHDSFITGIKAGEQALKSDWTNAIGNIEQPFPFGFQELAEVADMAGQCAVGLNNLSLFDRSPGVFWQLVDVKRFGLASWCRHLMIENQQLLQHLQQRPHGNQSS